MRSPVRNGVRHAARALLVLLCAAVSGVALPAAQANQGGTAVAGAFAELEPGARGAALAGALAAVIDDATAVYWNPARLVELDRTAAAVSYADLYGLSLARHTAVFLGFPHGERQLAWEGGRIRSGKAAATSALGLGFQATTIDFDPESYAEYDLALAYARRGPWDVSLGMTLHALFVHSDLEDVGASGYAGDLAMSRALSGRVTGSLTLRALVSRLSWDNDTQEHLRPTAQLALGATPMAQLRIPVALLLDLETSQLTQAALGLEWAPRGETLWLRAGARWRDDGDEARVVPACGVGLGWNGFAFDYGLALERDELGSTHRFGLRCRL